MQSYKIGNMGIHDRGGGGRENISKHAYSPPDGGNVLNDMNAATSIP